MLETTYEKLSELQLLPSSTPPRNELEADPVLAAQDEWLLPISLWLHGGWAVQLHYRKGQVPDYANDMARVAALEDNPYGIRDITVLPPHPHLIGLKHGFVRGPACYLTYRSDPGGEHHALLSALLAKGERPNLGNALPGEPLSDGRRFLTIGPAISPKSSDQSLVVVLASEDAVSKYRQWAGKRWASRGTPRTAWGLRATGETITVDSSRSIARQMRERGAHPVLAQAIATPEKMVWDGNAQLEDLVATDRANTEHGLRTTWAANRRYNPESSDDAEEQRYRAAAVAVLLAEIFGDEEPLREAVNWPPDPGEWPRLHPASVLAPTRTLAEYYMARRRVLGPRVLETLRAALEDSADATGKDYRITPFETIKWATDLSLDDRIGGRSTVYQPLVQRHLNGGDQGFIAKVLAAARAGTPDAEWLASPLAASKQSEPAESPTGAEALWRAMVASRLLPDSVVQQGVEVARSIVYLDHDDPKAFAIQVLEKAGIGREIHTVGETEPPYKELLLAFDEVSGGRVRIADIFQEFVDAERIALRWTQDGVRQEREVSGYRQTLRVEDAFELLPPVADAETGNKLQLWENEDSLVVLWAPPGAAHQYEKLISGE